MHTRNPGINPPPGGSRPGCGFTNASSPENHLAHLKTSSVPAASLLGWGPWILRIGSPKESISKGCYMTDLLLLVLNLSASTCLGW